MTRVVGIDPGTVSIDVCANRPLVERLRVREAQGTVLDYLLFVTPEAARQRLGLDDGR